MKKIFGIALILFGGLLFLSFIFQLDEIFIRLLSTFDPNITAYQRGRLIGYLVFHLIASGISVALVLFGRKLFKDSKTNNN